MSLKRKRKKSFSGKMYLSTSGNSFVTHKSSYKNFLQLGKTLSHSKRIKRALHSNKRGMMKDKGPI